MTGGAGSMAFCMNVCSTGDSQTRGTERRRGAAYLAVIKDRVHDLLPDRVDQGLIFLCGRLGNDATHDWWCSRDGLSYGTKFRGYW